MTDDANPVPAIALGLALVVTAILGVMLADTLITGRELRKAARRLREMPGEPPAPLHTEN